MTGQNEAAAEAKPEVTKAKPEPLRPVKSTAVTAGRTKPLEYVVRQFYCAVPMGTKFEDVLKPDFWRHEAKNFEIGTQIQIEPDDGVWFAWTKVIDVDKSGAKLAKLFYVELASSAETSVVDNYVVRHAGPVKRWIVVKNNEELQDGIATKLKAHAWAAEHAARMG